MSYNREKRVSGKTHYNVISMVSFAVAGLLTSSTFLMRFAAYVFPLFVLINLTLIIIDIYLSSSAPFKILVTFDFVYITFFLTIYGVYIARIYKNIIGRPIFIIDPKYSYTDKKLVDVSKMGRI